MASEASWIRQAAAIPFQAGQISLVTSRSGKRWVIPKGMIDPGHTAAEAALQEAWEEAGLVGLLSPHPVGTFFYEKWGNVHHVLVFLLQVTDIANEWPEKHVRERIWVTPTQALVRIDDRGLRAVLKATLLSSGAIDDRLVTPSIRRQRLAAQ